MEISHHTTYKRQFIVKCNRITTKMIKQKREVKAVAPSIRASMPNLISAVSTLLGLNTVMYLKERTISNIKSSRSEKSP